ncbi:thioredoxin domain-containing protein [Planomonospora sp. ID67723]|uniref:DsbA family protein n=1 Tax=Planomonospora sp. ID67723 TaxID=2738134 RepID=UPI0018C40928|nr:thioredoxin domain-containing protein [Planomonospora sp. ID67723]MBG0829582.1 thioredoxin domain-containing protein [Planomonospora sp. ID67723]
MGKAARDQSARDRIKAQREAERKKERARRVATMTTAAVVAVAAIGAGWWFAAQSSRPEQTTTALAPITRAADGTVVMAKPGVGKPVVDVYEDFQCPACKALEETSAATLKNLAAEGKAKVVFHTVTIFPQEMNKGVTRGNSVRGAAAARCVPAGPSWMTYHDRLFKEQPPETAEGFALDDLVAWGEDAGITDPNFAACVRNQQHAAAHVSDSDKKLEAAKIEGTPTLKIDGTAVDNNVAFAPAQLRQAILDAAK